MEKCELCRQNWLKRTAQNGKVRFVQTELAEKDCTEFKTAICTEKSSKKLLFKLRNLKINRKIRQEISVQIERPQNKQKNQARDFCSN